MAIAYLRVVAQVLRFGPGAGTREPHARGSCPDPAQLVETAGFAVAEPLEPLAPVVRRRSRGWVTGLSGSGDRNSNRQQIPEELPEYNSCQILR
jgi:hypothetical protein